MRPFRQTLRREAVAVCHGYYLTNAHLDMDYAKKT